MEEHQERAECQEVVTKDGGQAKLQWQYAKREKQERGNHPDERTMHTYGQKKKAAKRAADKAMRDMEEDVYSKLDEGGGKKMMFKMARDRQNSKDVKGGTVIKDRHEKLVI